MDHDVTVIVGDALGLVAGSLVGAPLLMLATRIVAKFVPGFRSAWGIELISSVASMVAGFIVGLAIGRAGRAAGLSPDAIKSVAYPAGLLIGFLIAALCIRWMIKRPDGGSLSWRHAFLVSLLTSVFGMATAALLAGGLHLLMHAP